MKTLKTTSIALMVLLVASFGLMAADMEKSAQFSIGNSYTLSVINSSSLEFSDGSAVTGVQATETYESSELEIKLDHNYNVEVSGSLSAFDLDTSTSDYDSSYAIPATWNIAWKQVSASNSYSSEDPIPVTSAGSTVSNSLNASINDTEGNAWGKISVTADRNGLDDPEGTYKANLEITVSDLG